MSEPTTEAGKVLYDAWASAADELVAIDDARRALPPGYRLDLTWPYSTRENPEPRWHASARKIDDYLGYIGHNDGGDTPADAARALTTALASERKS